MANTELTSLDENEVNSIIDAIQSSGGIIENVEWLADNIACDIYFAVLQVEEVQEILLHLLEPVPFDFAVQKADNRKKKLLICDMDSTVIEQECIDELADFAGIKDKISAITEKAMNGELDFKEALRERVALLEGISENVLQEAYDKNITFSKGIKKLVTTMKASGAKCILVSGGFTFFTSRVAEEIGFDIQEANILKIENGVLTGKVKEPILDSEAKLNALKFYCEDMGIGINGAMAVGDGANDLPMIVHTSNNSGVGVAYRAKPNVKLQALQAGAVKIDTCNLDALLYIQGYRCS